MEDTFNPIVFNSRPVEEATSVLAVFREVQLVQHIPIMPLPIPLITPKNWLFGVFQVLEAAESNLLILKRTS